ncbi:MAG TPA: SPOR domain-containing protein [Gammaproteobacteria bacterium]
MRAARIFSIWLLVVAAGVQAQSAAVVEGLQLPAWVNREGSQVAVKPGMELTAGDRIGTGGNGRLLIRLSEGSHVKLGENVSFEVKELRDGGSADDPFRGVWAVLRGAFRFTTSASGANRKRNIDIGVGTATMGIRGTDVWGKSNNEQDLICLIEGQIEVTREGDAPLAMTDPLTVYTAPRKAAPNPIMPAVMEELGKWAQETELSPGQGVLREDGAYIVYLLSTRNVDDAQRVRQRYQAAGYPAEVSSHQVNGTDWNRLGVTGFVSFNDARTFARRMEGVLETRGAWVARM